MLQLTSLLSVLIVVQLSTTSLSLQTMVHLVDVSNNYLIASLDGMNSGSGSTETPALGSAGGGYCG